jgi:hypothetical protein
MKVLKMVAILLAVLVLILAICFLAPPRVSVSGVPEGFTEQQFDTGK